MHAKRKIGKSHIEIAPLVLGCNVFGWTADEPTSFKILDSFFDFGFNCIDTADVYSKWAPGHTGGESETIIGNWLKLRGGRTHIVLATKVGMEMAPDQKGLSAKYIVQAVERSLKRLQTDYIDLYQSHADDPHTPLEETLKAYDSLVKAGKVRAIGASNYPAQRLNEALSISHAHHLTAYVCLQPQYNLLEREGYEAELEAVCQKQHLGVISYFSLANGFLSGKYRGTADLKKSTRGDRVQKYLNPQGMNVLAALDFIADTHKCSLAAVALAWVIQRPGITAPIASVTSLQQLKDIAECAEIHLSQVEMEKLNTASAGSGKPA